MRSLSLSHPILCSSKSIAVSSSLQSSGSVGASLGGNGLVALVECPWGVGFASPTCSSACSCVDICEVVDEMFSCPSPAGAGGCLTIGFFLIAVCFLDSPWCSTEGSADVDAPARYPLFQRNGAATELWRDLRPPSPCSPRPERFQGTDLLQSLPPAPRIGPDRGGKAWIGSAFRC